MSLASFNTETQVDKRRAKLRIVVGTLGFILALFFALPGDLFTSGKFFDNLGMQHVFLGGSPLFGPDSPVAWFRNQPELSYEGTGFTLALFVLNIVAAIKVSEAGEWADNVKSFPKLVQMWLKNKQIRNLNHVKLTIFVVYILGNLMDTLFDADFRAYGGAAGFALYFKSFLVSFFYYSLGSEWLLIESPQLAWGGFKALFGRTPQAALGELWRNKKPNHILPTRQESRDNLYANIQPNRTAGRTGQNRSGRKGKNRQSSRQNLQK